jgi:hypothetical protein
VISFILEVTWIRSRGKVDECTGWQYPPAYHFTALLIDWLQKENIRICWGQTNGGRMYIMLKLFMSNKVVDYVIQKLLISKGYSKNHSSSWEDKSPSVSQEMSHLLRVWKFINIFTIACHWPSGWARSEHLMKYKHHRECRIWYGGGNAVWFVESQLDFGGACRLHHQGGRIS